MPDTPPQPAILQPSTALAAAEQALAQAEQAAADRAASAAQRIDAAVAAWVQASLAGGPIARATECWNQLQSALPALKTAILKEIN